MATEDVIMLLRGEIGDFQAKMAAARGEVTELSAKGQSGFSQFNKVASEAFLAVGAASVVAGGFAIKMATDFDTAHQQLESAITGSGGSVDEFSGKVKALDGRMQNLGFGMTETEQALAPLVRATKNTGEAIDLVGLAADIARGKGESLGEASQQLANIELGRLRGLVQLGVAQKDANGKTITAAEAIQKLTALYKGDAQKATDDFAVKVDILRAKGENLGVTVGNVLIPGVEKLAGVVLDGVDGFQKFNGALDGVPGKMLAFSAGALLLYGAGVKVVDVTTSMYGAITSLIGVKSAEAAAEGADTVAVEANTVALGENAAAAEGAGAAAATAGVGMGAFAASATAGGAAAIVFGEALGNAKLNHSIGQMDGLHGAVATVGKSFIDALPGGQALTGTLGFLGVGAKKASDSHKDLAANAANAAQTQVKEAQTAADAAAAEKAHAQAVKDAAQALKDLYDAENSVIGGALSLEAANNSVSDAVDKANVAFLKLVQSHGKDTGAVHDNRDAQLALKKAVFDAGEAAGTNAANQVALDEATHHVVDTTQQATAKHQAEIAELRNLEKLVPSLTGTIEGYISTLNSIPPGENTTVTADTSQATAAINALLAQLGVAANSARGLAIIAASIQPGGGGRKRTRAAGGPVTEGEPYLIGEKGPELFVPKTSGTIIPNNKLGSSGGRSLGTSSGRARDTYNITVNTLDARTAGDVVIQAIQDYNRTKGPANIKVTAG